jgi:hypothetical protein
MRCKSCGSNLTGSERFCPSCGSPVRASDRDTALEAKKGEPKTRKVGIVLFPVIIVVGVFIFWRYINPSVHPVIQKQQIVSDPVATDTSVVSMTTIVAREQGSDLVFSLDDLKRYRLVKFEYSGGKTTRYIMAYIAPDGRLVTAISLSEHCGSTDFKIKGNEIQCANCPSRWHIETMEAYACCAKYYPDPIPSRVIKTADGDEVHIEKAVVEQWAGRL